MAAQASKAAAPDLPRLPRNIACAICMAAKQLEARERLGVVVLLPGGKLIAFQNPQPRPVEDFSPIATIARFSMPPPDAGRPTVDLASAVRLKMAQDVPKDDGSTQRVLNQTLCTLTTRMVPQGGELHVTLMNGAVLEALLGDRLSPEAARAALCSPADCSLYVYHELFTRNNEDGSDVLQAINLVSALLYSEPPL